MDRPRYHFFELQPLTLPEDDWNPMAACDLGRYAERFWWGAPRLRGDRGGAKGAKGAAKRAYFPDARREEWDPYA